jgi:hypothetical protein
VAAWYHPKGDCVVLYEGAFLQREIAESIAKAGTLAAEEGRWTVAWVLDAIPAIAGVVVVLSRCQQIKMSAYFGSAGAGKRKGFMR